MVSHVRARLGHPLGGPDIPLADLHEAAAPTRVDSVAATKPAARQAVEHHVHPGPLVSARNWPAKSACASCRRVHTQGPQVVLLGLAGRGEDLGPGRWANWTAARPTPPAAA